MLNRRTMVFGSLLLASAMAEPHAGAEEAGAVTLMPTPNGGIQPQAAVDSRGVVHLIYYKGDPKAGDLFYASMKSGGKQFSAPIQVNSQPGSAIAMGTIRGGQIAIGADDRVHVAWNGSDKAEPTGPGGNPMLFTSLNTAGTAFEPQRNLITWAGGLDGGGTLAADRTGNVYVVWHANPNRNGEENRAVYLTHSTDNGRTFARERRINSVPTGVCGCCALRAFVDHNNRVYVFYRAATAKIYRDMFLLTSSDKGATFRSEKVHPWNINACPMSSSSMTQTRTGIQAAWETQEQVYFADFRPEGAMVNTPIVAPSGGRGPRKHPVVVANANGQTLLAWTEGTGWSRGGSLAWQVYGPEGPLPALQGRQPGVPVWGVLTAFARPDGGFTLLY
jgi:hypothetical protein